MATRKNDEIAQRNSRIRELRRLGMLLLPLLADLSDMRCPNCGSRRLRADLTSHDSVTFACDGTDDSKNSSDEYECLYYLRVPFEPRHAELIAVEVEAVSHLRL